MEAEIQPCETQPCLHAGWFGREVGAGVFPNCLAVLRNQWTQTTRDVLSTFIHPQDTRKPDHFGGLLTLRFSFPIWESIGL